MTLAVKKMSYLQIQTLCQIYRKKILFSFPVPIFSITPWPVLSNQQSRGVDWNSFLRPPAMCSRDLKGQHSHGEWVTFL